MCCQARCCLWSFGLLGLLLSAGVLLILREMDYFKTNDLLNDSHCQNVIELPRAVEDLEIFKDRYLLGTLTNLV